MKPLRHFDAFSGIGGFALAASYTQGIETIAYCEIDPYCHKVLRKNFGKDIQIFNDITKLGHTELDPLRPVDLFTGGFPCQPYSIAGKRRGDDDDRALWREMLRVVEILKPTWVVGENVANFVNMALDDLLTDLEGQGYEVQPFLIPASGVGAPHKRERCFIVAHSKRGKFQRQRGHRTLESKAGTGANSAEERKRVWNAARDLRANVSDSQCGRLQGGAVRPTASKAIQSAARDFAHGRIWAAEPELGRVANGIPHRMDRLRGLGNAVVPQQVYPILQAIVDIEFAK